MAIIANLLLLLLFLFMTGLVCGSKVYNVLDYGARGNSRTDDSQAFLKAWAAACGYLLSATLLIPSSKTFLLSQTEFQGPCNATTRVHLEGSSTLVAPNKIWTREVVHWIMFRNINNLIIDGSGTFDGRGSIWWYCKSKNRCNQIPNTFGIMGCQDVTISGVNFKNSPGKHMTVYASVRVRINSLSITAPESSLNTDGMLIQDSQYVEVTNSYIGTGDDCIAIGTGTSDVNITQITCGPGHGISVGSLGGQNSEASVENIWVYNCTLSNTMTGARIKTWQGGSGYARNISFEKMRLDSVEQPIVIDQYYCGTPNSSSAVKVSDVSFTSMHGTASTEVAVSLACSESVACMRILMRDVSITPVLGIAKVSSYCLNAHGRKRGRVSPDVPCLSS